MIQQIGREDFFNAVMDRYSLDERERKILDWYFGVSEGERITLREIGERLGEKNPKDKLSRQRVHAIINRLKADLGTVWQQLEVFFPEPISDSRYRKMVAKRRSSILKYLRTLDETATLQYMQIHRALGFQPPVVRENAATMDEFQTCVALMEDYGAKNFGKYRYCTGCRKIKLASEFYRMANGYLYQLCGHCNTKRCLQFARTGDGSVVREEAHV